MAVDGAVRQGSGSTPVSKDTQAGGFAAGSKALDSLDRLITSVESFFHPSNHGKWTVNVSYDVANTCDHLLDRKSVV